MPSDQSTYVKTKSPSYIAYEDKWAKVRAVITSETLPYLRNVGANESNPTAAFARQKAYEDGAIFYNFTKRTVDGMVGSIYRKDPEVELPPELEYLLDDADGNGQGLIQQSQDSVREDIEIGRLGLFVDMPPQPVDNEGNARNVTLQEQNDGMANPKIQMYKAESIINWRTERIGSVNKVVMVVLVETFEYQSGDNDFMWLTGTQYRALDIVNGEYRQRIWRFNNVGESLQSTDNQTSFDEFYPKANGAPMTEIPFVFVGADNNDFDIDEPPMYPLAELNIGHYRNYADNEEMLFMVAQAMLILAPGINMTPKQWAESNPDGVKFGSRSGLNVGSGGTATLLQAAPNSALSVAITQKEEQAVAIGAQLITPTQQVTAEAARIQRGADTSVLSSIANNVSAGYQKCLNWCLLFLGSTSEAKFMLSKDFFFTSATAQDIDAIVRSWQSGAISKDVMDKYLVEGGVIPDTTDLEEMNKDIEAESDMVDLDAPVVPTEVVEVNNG